MESKFKPLTQEIELPSKGLVYPVGSELSKGKIELYHMTAKHEDILTNINLLKKGTVIDELLKSLIATKINYEDLLLGDRNAILIAARILGYGAEYPIKFRNEDTGNQEDYVVDLTKLDVKPIDETLFTPGNNEFTYQLPQSKYTITFKLLTNKDERLIEEEIKGLTRMAPKGSFEITTRLKYMITSVDGSRDKGEIKNFIDNFMPAKDSKSLKSYYDSIMPDVDMTITIDKDGYVKEGVRVPVNTNFFWPE